MAKFMGNTSFDTINKIADNVSDILAKPEPAINFDKWSKSLGERSPLYRVTGIDHRVNSTEIPCGSR